MSQIIASSCIMTAIEKCRAFRTILVLGMAFVSPSYVKASLAQSNQATCAPARDALRLEQWEAHFPNTRIISMNMAQTSQECLPHTHIQGSYGRRSVKGIQNVIGSAKFDAVYLDYFRFPGPYLMQAYGEIKDMLVAMQRRDMFAVGACVFLPNHVDLLNTFQTIPHEVEVIDASQHELYVATELVQSLSNQFQIVSQAFGSYVNSEQLLNQHTTQNNFVRMRLHQSN
jgi:hypothetical protein